MSSKAEELIRDPLFQLNAVLWMAQPLPTGIQIEPLLYRRGFGIWSIAPPLAPPPDIRLRAQERSVRLEPSVRPDVVLANTVTGRFAVTECKKSSFAPESSTAEQARSLLILAGPRCHEVLGITKIAVSGSIAAFLMPQDQTPMMSPTLGALGNELDIAGLAAGASCLLGLCVLPEGIALVSDKDAAAFFSLPSLPAKFIEIEGNNDPNPLYFIPYDPDLDQPPDERRLSRRILFERLLSGVITATGRGDPPFNLLLQMDQMLNDAMFGMYGQWENPGARKHMRRLCREFMNALSREIEKVVPGALTYEPPTHWHVTCEGPEQRGKVLNALTRFSCEDFVLGPPPKPELFDDVEDS